MKKPFVWLLGIAAVVAGLFMLYRYKMAATTTAGNAAAAAAAAVKPGVVNPATNNVAQNITAAAGLATALSSSLGNLNFGV